jgi:hypothetical protein
MKLEEKYGCAPPSSDSISVASVICGLMQLKKDFEN